MGSVQWAPRGRRHAAAVDDVAVRLVSAEPRRDDHRLRVGRRERRNALRSIAVGASIDLICSLTSELPVDVFRGEGSQRQLTLPNLQDRATPVGGAGGLALRCCSRGCTAATPTTRSPR